jgi:ribosomal protein S18 acetylase RimI-like enzyme
MDVLQLDNPVWHSLNGAHQSWAHSRAPLVWYPPDVAPFAALPCDDLLPDLDGARAAGMGNSVYFVGVCPNRLPEGWREASRSRVLQMLPTRVDSPEPMGARTLLEQDRAAMRALAALAFPDFFRARTAELGLYLGIVRDGALAGMAGERMAMGEFQEISGVCTHPKFAGRGFARQLTLSLQEHHRRRGLRSFLHVSEGNTRARDLYQAMGFAVRAGLEMVRVEAVG